MATQPTPTPKSKEPGSRIEEAAGILVAAPVYNFDMNAALKNLVELTGSAWEGKVVGFLNAAGGDTSYMSVMSMASSLMLDFRCVIVPRFVYATGSAFRDGVVSDRKVAGRIDELAKELVRFAKRFRSVARDSLESCAKKRSQVRIWPGRGKNSHDNAPRVCYANRSCLCKEKVRSLVVFRIW